MSHMQLQAKTERADALGVKVEELLARNERTVDELTRLKQSLLDHTERAGQHTQVQAQVLELQQVRYCRVWRIAP